MDTDTHPKYPTWCSVERRHTLKIVETTEDGQTITCCSCGKVWELFKIKDGEHISKDALTEEELEQLEREIKELYDE